MNKYVLALAFASMALAGCDKVESLPSEEPGVISLRTSVGEYTKASGLDSMSVMFSVFISWKGRARRLLPSAASITLKI